MMKTVYVGVTASTDEDSQEKKGWMRPCVRSDCGISKNDVEQTWCVRMDSTFGPDQFTCDHLHSLSPSGKVVACCHPKSKKRIDLEEDEIQEIAYRVFDLVSDHLKHCILHAIEEHLK